MTITNYICDLLYRYDCVIVPDFGAFLTKRIGAHLSHDSHLMYPPQKQLSFNQQIVTNDGLLANSISSYEKISYDKAVEKLNYFVQEIRQELLDTKKLSLSEIGFFTTNFEDKLVFEPMHTANYLPEAFGLNTLQPQQLLRETLKEEVKILEEKAPIAFTPEKRKFRGLLKYAAAAVIVFAVAGIGLKSYQNNIINQNNAVEIAAGEQVNEEIQSASFVIDIANPLPSINVNVIPKIEDAAQTPFHIVAGAFREYANAEKKIRQLTRKGFTPKYIGENKYGLHQVVYNSYTSRNEAIIELNVIKRTENEAAWLLIER